MTPAAHTHERDERVDPLNTLLDAFDVQVRALVEMGLEAQLRARLARLLPPEASQALVLSKVLTALREASQGRMSDAQRNRNREARAIVTDAMRAA